MTRCHRLFAVAFFAASLCAPINGQQLLPPSGSGLLPVPLPRLDDTEASVVTQIRELEKTVSDAAASSTSSKTLAESYGSLARAYHAYQLFEAAEAAYLNASRLNSLDVRWPHLLGALYQQTGRHEEAADRYFAALRLRRDNHPATLHLGEVLLQLNRLPEARLQFENVAAVFPAAASNGLGEVALRQGRFDAAISHFRSALDRVPTAGSIHYSLAMAYRGLGRIDQARAHLERRTTGGIHAVDPIVDELQTLIRGERALVIQGGRAFEAGQFEEAANAFRKAVGEAPSSIAARVNLGLALAGLGRASEAAEQFETALRFDPANVTARASLGIMRAREGRDADALAHLRPAFESAPENVAVREQLVSSLLRLGREDDAMAVLTRISAADPGDENAIVRLSILLAHRERYRDATSLLDEANRRLPDRMLIMTTLARLLASAPDLSLRDGGRALRLAMAVYTASPSSVHRETVAMALAEMGRCKEAAEWMRLAIDQAERDGDRAETARLKSETGKYGTTSCRPPGQ